MKNVNERIDEAIKIFGQDIVYTVTALVDISDADGVYTMMEDLGKWEAAECISYLYFEH